MRVQILRGQHNDPGLRRDRHDRKQRRRDGSAERRYVGYHFHDPNCDAWFGLREYHTNKRFERAVQRKSNVGAVERLYPVNTSPTDRYYAYGDITGRNHWRGHRTNHSVLQHRRWFNSHNNQQRHFQPCFDDGRGEHHVARDRSENCLFRAELAYRRFWYMHFDHFEHFRHGPNLEES
jgi:hypothetical protein